MPVIRVTRNSSLRDFQDAILGIYAKQDDRLYSVWDMLSNLERFTMRSIKGIRKNDLEKTKLNLIIAVAWLLALMNRFHMDLEHAVKDRFSYCCSYCGEAPCTCKVKKVQKRKVRKNKKVHTVKTLSDFQKMFEEIYPSASRTLDHAGVHMAEEVGEISEAVHIFLGEHKANQMREIAHEAADFYSCVMGVANSAGIDFGKEAATLFSKNCHVCHKIPCQCTFQKVIKFES